MAQVKNLMKNFSQQRETILSAVRNTRCHPRAEWVHNKVKETMPNVSLGTVYRNLGVLAENGRINAIQIEGATHYDGVTEMHQHFYCTACETIYDIELSNKTFVSKVEQKTKHHITESLVMMKGICELCQTQKTKENQC
jgi:Fur family peroxide stress response transcriptional regulator